jgi:oxygen-independent coproporphyrinogen-3 oxidase
LEKIKKSFFQGSLDYTKNQPDFFLPHKYKPVAPSTVNTVLEEFKASIASEKTLLIYVHLPFCFSECVFCNSFPHKTDQHTQALYLESILREIELFAAAGVFEGKQVQSIYMGGGTPTSFSNENICAILNKIKDSMTLMKGASITTEAHPLKGRDKNLLLVNQTIKNPPHSEILSPP